MMPDKTRLERVTFMRPAGNDTAIIWDQMSREDYASVARQIQRDFPNIEQVMFAETNPQTGLVRGQMTGGEFCANATRSLAYLLMQGKNGSIDIEVSGATSITAYVSADSASIIIPLKKSPGALIKINDTAPSSVNMGGIIHLVCFEGEEFFRKINCISNIDEKKYYIRQILNAEAYKNYPACGMMLARRKDNSEIAIDPFVYVRETGTLYNETACASGSAAVAMMCAFQQKRAVQNLKILQPSGLYICADVAYENGSFQSVTVGGGIQVLYDGELILDIDAGEIRNAL